jgi:hypothetical protein
MICALGITQYFSTFSSLIDSARGSTLSVSNLSDSSSINSPTTDSSVSDTNMAEKYS